MRYITDIFYLDNGQFNWDAISTISNILLVLALVFLTWWYASQVKKQTDLTIKDIERRPILDGVREFLIPVLGHLKNEIDNIKNHNLKFYKRDGISTFSWGVICKFSDKEYGIGFAKNDVFRNNPPLEQLFSNHDLLYDNLIEIYEKIKETLENTIQIDRLKYLVEQFNRNQKEEANKLKGDALNNPIEYFIYYFINYEYHKKHGSDGDYKVKFLKEFEELIVRCIESDELQKLRKDEQNKLNEFIGIDEKILEKIKEIIGDYHNEYNFMENEINPPKYNTNPYKD